MGRVGQRLFNPPPQFSRMGTWCPNFFCTSVLLSPVCTWMEGWGGGGLLLTGWRDGEEEGCYLLDGRMGRRRVATYWMEGWGGGGLLLTGWRDGEEEGCYLLDGGMGRRRVATYWMEGWGGGGLLLTGWRDGEEEGCYLLDGGMGRRRVATYFFVFFSILLHLYSWASML